MNELEISGDAFNLLNIQISNSHYEVIDHNYQDELFEMFLKYRNDIIEGDENEENLYDEYKELIHRSLEYYHNMYEDILEDFDEVVKGYDYVKLCIYLKEEYGEDLDILDYQMIVNICITHEGAIRKSFIKLLNKFTEPKYDEDNIFNHLCRTCEVFETYGAEKLGRCCDACMKPAIIKIQSIIRGHNQRWRCPLFMFNS
tara:strand:- start:1534 stop:2133 length:600 start_codon:yes stop_codon:yes gene_type:complete